jgi:hypothetical protein
MNLPGSQQATSPKPSRSRKIPCPRIFRFCRAGLVSAQRFSRSIVYRADLARLQEVMLFMLRDCCDGRPEICAPLVERLTPCCPPSKKKRAHAKI